MPWEDVREDVQQDGSYYWNDAQEESRVAYCMYGNLQRNLTYLEE